MNLERYEELRGQIEEAQRNQSQAEGALLQLMTQLKKDFDCSSLEEALELSKKIGSKIGKIEKEYEPAADELERELEERLE